MPKLVLDTTEWYSLGIPNTFNNISENVTVNISPVIDLLISLHDKFIIEDYYSITKQDIINIIIMRNSRPVFHCSMRLFSGKIISITATP